MTARKSGQPPRISLVLLVLLLAVCSFGNREAASENTPPSLKPGDMVRAAVPRSFPPDYLVNDRGEPTGFAIDTMNEIARLAGLRVAYQVYANWEAANEAVLRGRADLIPNQGITAQRRQMYDFTTPL